MPDPPLEHVHRAPESPTGGPAPAVFVLHGRGADEEDLLPVVEDFPAAMHVVSLRAPNRLRAGYTWYEGSTDEFRRSLDLVSEAIDDAVERFDLDESSLGLLGFSQGAVLSLGLLCEHPERYAWVAALHGVLAESRVDCDVAGLADKPVFVGTGARDRIISPEGSEAAAERFDEWGADVTFSVYESGHEIGPTERRDVTAFVRGHVTGGEGPPESDDGK